MWRLTTLVAEQMRTTLGYPHMLRAPMHATVEAEYAPIRSSPASQAIQSAVGKAFPFF